MPRRPRRPVAPTIVAQPDAFLPAEGTQVGVDLPVAIRVRRGAYALLDASLTGAPRDRAIHLARCLAVERKMSTRHVFCRESAAIAHGLRTWRVPRSVQVIASTRVSGRGIADVDRHLLDVPDKDVETVDDLPVLRLEALAVDAARFLHPRDSLVVVDHLLSVATAADPREPHRVERECAQVRARLDARVDELPAGARGVRTARAVLRWATPWSESAWESHVRWVLLAWGCREVRSQVVVIVGDTTYRTDLAIPVGRRTDGSTIWLHIEFDGLGKYGQDPGSIARALHAERRRELAITSTGDRLIRLRADEAGDPTVVLAK
jgi:hypothetical protein